MDTYLSKGFRCTVDGLLFSNFTFSAYVSGTDGGAPPLTANMIYVDPISGGLMFSSGYIVGNINLSCDPNGTDTCPTGLADSFIGYTVRALGNQLINGLTFSFYGFGPDSSDGRGGTTPREIGTLSSAFFSPIVLACVDEGQCPGDGIPVQQSITFPRLHRADVLYEDYAYADNGAIASWDASSVQFSLVQGPVPEPTGLLLMGTSLASCALIVRRKLALKR